MRSRYRRRRWTCVSPKRVAGSERARRREIRSASGMSSSAAAGALGFFLFFGEAFAGFGGEAAALFVALEGAGRGGFVEFALLGEFFFARALLGFLVLQVGFLALGFEVGALEVFFCG